MSNPKELEPVILVELETKVRANLAEISLEMEVVRNHSPVDWAAYNESRKLFQLNLGSHLILKYLINPAIGIPSHLEPVFDDKF